MADGSDGRLINLEREMGALQQQVADVINDVQQLDPVRMSVVWIEGTVEVMSREVVGLREAMEKDRENSAAQAEALREEIQKLRDAAAEQADASKRQIIAGVVAIIVALIPVIAAIFITGGPT